MDPDFSHATYQPCSSKTELVPTETSCGFLLLALLVRTVKLRLLPAGSVIELRPLHSYPNRT